MSDREPEVDRSGPNPSLRFVSGGFELYVPPTPLRPPPEEPLFVMLEDARDVFYEVDYKSADLRNTVSWSELRLHTITDPAIVFPPVQWQKFEGLADSSEEKVTGFLVSIVSREEDGWQAVRLGSVHVRRYPEAIVNWRALESIKGPELPAEMRSGLLRRLFDRRPGSTAPPTTFVTSGATLDAVSIPFHQDGAALNWHLDERFVGAARIASEQHWRLFAE